MSTPMAVCPINPVDLIFFHFTLTVVSLSVNPGLSGDYKRPALSAVFSSSTLAFI